MAVSKSKQDVNRYAPETLREICLDAGADDCGFVDVDREALEKEREGILKVYSRTRSVISIIRVMNRENMGVNHGGW